MMIDSHCHLDCLDLSSYEGEVDLAIQAARQEGVSHFLCVCIDLDNYPTMKAIADKYDCIDTSVGVHPNTDLEVEVTTDQLIELANDPKVVAIGETGLDYFRTQGAQLEKQPERFRRHIRASIAVNKPLIIHTRDAREDTITILKEEGADRVGGVLHCFTENWEMACAGMSLGFYISFSGIVTFKNAKDLQEVAKKVPLEWMLIETDSPYLAPMPYRGKSNEPQYVRFVAEAIAKLRGVSTETVAKQTTDNYFRMIGRDGRC